MARRGTIRMRMSTLLAAAPSRLSHLLATYYSWVERVADKCVRERRREVKRLDERFFAGVSPAPVAKRGRGRQRTEGRPEQRLRDANEHL